MFTSFIDSKILSLQNFGHVGNGVLLFDKRIAEMKDGAMEIQAYIAETIGGIY